MTPFPPNEFLALRPVSRLRSAISAGPSRLRADARIIFVCGAQSKGDWTSNREVILNYVQRHLNQFHFFLAEDVFLALDGSSKTDLLSMEDELGRFSDCIIIVCESPGSFAELGAFALSNNLAGQLLIINDDAFRSGNSFINHGPIKRSDRESKFSPALYTDFRAILRVVPQLEERLLRIPHLNRSAVALNGTSFGTISPKARLLFLVDVITLLGPISLPELVTFVREVTGTQHVHCSTELALAQSLKLISTGKDAKGRRFYFHAVSEPAHFFDFSGINRLNLRAEVMRVYSQTDRDRLSDLRNHVFRRA